MDLMVGGEAKMLEQFLQQLSAELGRELNLKKEGKTVVFSLNPELAVTLTETEEGVSIWARIAPLPAEKREEFTMHLMAANFLGQGTGGAVLGLESDEKFLTLSLAFPYDINYKIFKDALEDFANYVDYWRAETKRHIELANQGILR